MKDPSSCPAEKAEGGEGGVKGQSGELRLDDPPLFRFHDISHTLALRFVSRPPAQCVRRAGPRAGPQLRPFQAPGSPEFHLEPGGWPASWIASSTGQFWLSKGQRREGKGREEEEARRSPEPMGSLEREAQRLRRRTGRRREVPSSVKFCCFSGPRLQGLRGAHWRDVGGVIRLWGPRGAELWSRKPSGSPVASTSRGQIG